MLATCPGAQDFLAQALALLHSLIQISTVSCSPNVALQQACF